MALVFSASASDRVAIAPSASLNNLAELTVLAWCYPTDYLSAPLVMKGRQTSVAGWQFGALNTGYLTFTAWRATANATVSSNTLAFGLNTWYFLGASFKQGGIPKLYNGAGSRRVSEPGYAAGGTAGSGAFGDDSSYNLNLGNVYALTTNYRGWIGWVGVWNRALSLDEIKEQQFGFRPTPGCVLCTHLGLSTASLPTPDYSGRGNLGTVSGPTWAPHMPIGQWVTPTVISALRRQAPPPANGPVLAVRHFLREVGGAL